MGSTRPEKPFPAADLSMLEGDSTVRIHLWLETDAGVFFGIGRAQLLARIEERGSLKKAADDLGMSYRAAWGKIRRTEAILGVKLISQNASKREGCQLTEFGSLLKQRYFAWFKAVEEVAIRKAREIFPWPVRSHEDGLFQRARSSDRNKASHSVREVSG